MSAVIQHIRKPLPARRGNSFYRDKRDLSAFAATFCGAPVTAYDLNSREWGSKVAQEFYRQNAERWVVCPDCKAEATT